MPSTAVHLSPAELVEAAAKCLEESDQAGYRGYRRVLRRRYNYSALQVKREVAEVVRELRTQRPEVREDGSLDMSVAANQAVTKYMEEGLPAFEAYLKGLRERDCDLAPGELLKAGLLDEVARKAAEAFLGNHPKQVLAHQSFARRYESVGRVSWAFACAFAKVSAEKMSENAHVEATRLYNGAFRYARRETVVAAFATIFAAMGLDFVNLTGNSDHGVVLASA